MNEVDISVSDALHLATGIAVRCGGSLRDLLVPLKREELTAFVVDQRLLDAEAATAELVWKYAGAALPVVVNPAIQSEARIVSEVKGALERRERERKIARDLERAAMAAELAGPLTGLLVNLAIVLEDKKLARTTRIRLERVQRIAERMREVVRGQ